MKKIYNKWTTKEDGTKVYYYKEPNSVKGFKKGDIVYVKGIKYKIHSFGRNKSCSYYKPRKDGRQDKRYGYYYTRTVDIFTREANNEKVS